MSPIQKSALAEALSDEGLPTASRYYSWNVINALLTKGLIYLVAEGGLYRATTAGQAAAPGLHKIPTFLLPYLNTLYKRDGVVATAKTLNTSVTTLDKAVSCGVKYATRERIVRRLQDVSNLR